MTRGLRIAGTAAIVATALAGRARADDAEPIAVAYDAPDGCPGESAFFREIVLRTDRARAAAPGERARTIHVVVAKRGDVYGGRLWMEDAGGAGGAREVSGKSCAEIVGALGLIGALAVDPRASVTPRTTPSSTVATIGTSTPAATGASPIGSAPAELPAERPAATTTPEKPRETAGPPDKPVEPPRPSTPGSRRRGRFEVGAGVEVAFVAGPVGAGRLFGDLELGPSNAIFAPSLRLGVARSLDVDRTAAVGGATFHWTVGSLDVCPLRLAFAQTLAARPCAGTEIGIVDATGTGVTSTDHRSRPWASLSAQARLVWEPIRWLGLELEAGAVAPLYRESFFFMPGVQVYEAPTAAFLSRASIGVRFP